MSKQSVYKLDFSDPLQSDCVREMEKHARFSKKDVVEHFDSIAVNYDDCMKSNGYPDPEYVAKFLKKYADQKNMSLQDTKILDFGCGTGLVGEELKKIGCSKIDGIDCSAEMITIAKRKGNYNEVYNSLLGLSNYMESLPF